MIEVHQRDVPGRGGCAVPRLKERKIPMAAVDEKGGRFLSPSHARRGGGKEKERGKVEANPLVPVTKQEERKGKGRLLVIGN